jgi:hypothetical protein
MLGIGISNIIPFQSNRRGITLDPDLVTYMTGLVTPLSAGQVTILDWLFKYWKQKTGAGALSELWDQALILNGDTVESSYRNIVKRAFDATPVNSPTWTQYEGVKGNGINQYIDTNWNGRTEGHANAYTLNSASFWIYQRNYTFKQGVASYEIHGTRSLTEDGGLNNRIAVVKPSGGTVNLVGVINAGGAEAGAATSDYNGTDIIGMRTISRTASDLQTLYYRGNNVATNTKATTKIPNQNVLLLAERNEGAVIGQYDNDQTSFSALGAGMNSTEVADITDGFNEYLTYHGKNPL